MERRAPRKIHLERPLTAWVDCLDTDGRVNKVWIAWMDMIIMKVSKKGKEMTLNIAIGFVS